MREDCRFFGKHSKSILSVAQCVALGERRNGLGMFPKKRQIALCARDPYVREDCRFFGKHSKSILSVAQCVALGERRNGLAMFPKKRQIALCARAQ